MLCLLTGQEQSMAWPVAAYLTLMPHANWNVACRLDELLYSGLLTGKLVRLNWNCSLATARVLHCSNAARWALGSAQ
jgi:hypothetical protein